MLHHLPVDLSWHQSDTYIFFPILLAILFFSIYWFTAKSEKIKSKFYNRNEPEQASLYHITFNRIVGFVSMGIFPIGICLVVLPRYSPAGYGLGFNSATSMFSLLWIIVLSIVVIPVAYFSAQKPENLLNYPQIRTKLWTNKTALINSAGWVLYLLGYEILFRGVLLFPVADQIGVWPAVAINIALYSATHIPKGMAETIGAAPLGLVFCILTLQSGTIWIAFVVHLVLALTNCYTALKFNTGMQYIRSRK